MQDSRTARKPDKHLLEIRQGPPGCHGVHGADCLMKCGPELVIDATHPYAAGR
ncbi:MAG: hypothetical protein ACLTW9_00315 [Enterocloster sp.]